ncbi:hypothetical protein T10_11510 [Trichinella papuae]|uniref:Uncharacterized protein n=1 Tax=Trichinella papuae TaxID=268474 RepID=A0A0V1M438_9BILA|nr:hypothetical protein T10_11510 [Trichinella papuae]
MIKRNDDSTGWMMIRGQQLRRIGKEKANPIKKKLIRSTCKKEHQFHLGEHFHSLAIQSNNYLLDVKAQVKKELMLQEILQFMNKIWLCCEWVHVGKVNRILIRAGRRIESSDFEKIIGEIMKVNNVAVSALSNVEAFKFASVGLIYDFAWWRKFVVVLAPFRCNNCFHCSTLDPGHLCSIIRMKAYEKAASRAECSEESSVD